MDEIIPTPEPRERAVRAATPSVFDLLLPQGEPQGFFSFRYSYAEFSTQGGRTQVKGRHVRLEDGKLSSESFEGELGPNAYVEAMREAQERMLAQFTSLMNPLTWFLPRLPHARDERD
jgi:hypothetical protein